MTEYTGAWGADQVAEFLQDITVPVRLATPRPDGTLWMVTLWYRYHDGGFECATGADADIVSYLRQSDQVSFDISTNEVPYRGIRGHGTTEIGPDEDKAVIRDLIERYLGGTESQLAQTLLADGREEVRIKVEPERIFSWDYSERMADATGD
jgi:nitroimidazol reductase NimA-like FMN-containing flavoprotein (pyridoxamine 5'-phosphate oxidase superfamily)